MEVLFATKNPAKIKYYAEELKKEKIQVCTLSDQHVDCKVEETGENAIENAKIKAKAYYEQTKMKTIAIDDTLYLEGVSKEDQPGAKVRRIKGKELTDEEMLTYYIALVHKYGGKVQAKWVKGVAIYDGKEFQTHQVEGSNFYLVETISNVRHEGYPLDSITILPELNQYLSETKKEDYERTRKGSSSKQILDFLKEGLSENEEKK